MVLAVPAAAGTKFVDSVKALNAAVGSASPGDEIVLAPGTYKFSRIKIRRHGTKELPITMRAGKRGTVFLKATGEVALDVQASYWKFEDLDIEGICTNHSWCEHAFHISGLSLGTILRRNVMHGYNAMIKGNGRPINRDGRKVQVFPSDVLIENNIFYNREPRKTQKPVNFINLDGGKRWIIRGNLIADFAKVWGQSAVAFGGYTKGMARDSLFERNLVICELMHHGGIRVGLSFGGGGTGMAYRDDPIGDIENLNGTMRNNIIINCPNDVGIYVNKGAGTKIYNNTMYNTFGIDVRFVESDALIVNNIIGGGVRERDEGKATLENNLVAGTTVGMWLPGTTRYVLRRIEGQDRKFPNYVDKSDVEYVQSLVRKAIKLVSNTWIGTGNNKLENIFIDPANGDFGLQDPDDIVDQGIVLPEVTDDYCGNPRKPPYDLGAIEYSSGGCNPADLIRQILPGN